MTCLTPFALFRFPTHDGTAYCWKLRTSNGRSDTGASLCCCNTEAGLCDFPVRILILVNIFNALFNIHVYTEERELYGNVHAYLSSRKTVVPIQSIIKNKNNGHIIVLKNRGDLLVDLTFGYDSILTHGRESSLLYSPYMDFLWNALSTSASGLKCQTLDRDIMFRQSKKGQGGAEIHNWLFCSDQLRRIRFTYFDAGYNGQAFNSLIYPDYRFDLPLLGIDLLSFGKGKILCVVDFQPLFQDSSYLEKYTSHLASIRGDFSKFCSRMTKRIYNEDMFFSKELIFYRSEKGGSDSALQVPDGLFFKVYQAYVTSYLNLVESSDPREDIFFKARVKRQQAAYDSYSYTRDPAVKFLSIYFGEKWTERMAKEFLFPSAESNETL